LSEDPVRARRARYDRASRLGQRAGYLCYLVAVVAFFVGFATSYSTALVAVIVGGLAVGSILLLPSIIVGYAVKAAEREDREQGR
jgi:heme/copper-type cytochrome/quinol oxidase subunit 3